MNDQIPSKLNPYYDPNGNRSLPAMSAEEAKRRFPLYQRHPDGSISIVPPPDIDSQLAEILRKYARSEFAHITRLVDTISTDEAVASIKTLFGLTG